MTPSLEGECLTPGTLEALGFGALICEYRHLPLDRIDHFLLNPGLDHAKSPQDPVGNSALIAATMTDGANPAWAQKRRSSVFGIVEPGSDLL